MFSSCRRLPGSFLKAGLLRIDLLTACILPAGAQNNPNEEQGLKPYDSWHGGDLDSVSLTNGGLVLHIPLVSFPQRGNLDLSFSVVFSNKQWQKHTAPKTGVVSWNPLPLTGTRVVSSLDLWLNQSYSETTDSTGATTVNLSRSVTAPNGNAHQFGLYGGPAYPLRSLDPTGWLDMDTHTVTATNGKRYTYPSAFDACTATARLSPTAPHYICIQPLAVTD